MRRHDARIMALSALFCWELTKDEPVAVFDQVAQGFFGAGGEAEAGRAQAAPLKPSQDKRFEYARDLFLCAVESAPRIDPYIARASQGWPVSRMPRVDLSILRLAVAETMCLKAAPFEVVIDEAVELCKEFSTHASPRFVNGVLMGIFRDVGYAKNPREE